MCSNCFPEFNLVKPDLKKNIIYYVVFEVFFFNCRPLCVNLCEDPLPHFCDQSGPRSDGA